MDTNGGKRGWTLSEYNTIITSVAFLLIFSAFGTVQNFEAGGNKTEGAISLAILYTCFTLANLAAPKMINYFSTKVAMILGSATYVLYVAANIKVETYTLYPSAAIMGCGAALLWVAQGAFVTECSNHFERRFGKKLNSKLGYFNGIFWMIYMFNQFVGNLLAALLFEFKVNKSVIFIVLTAINIAGVLCFLLIRKFPKIDTNEADGVDEQLLVNQPPNDNEDDGDGKKKDEVSIFAAIRLWTVPNLQKVMLLIMYNGVEQAVCYGEFTALIINENETFHAYYTMAVFGAVDAAFSKIWGNIGDKHGRLPIFIIGIICHAACYIALYLKDTDIVPFIHYNLYFFIPIAILLGIGDAAFNTQISALLPELLNDKKKAEVFANYKFFQAMATALTFAYIPSGVAWKLRLYTYLGVLIVSSIIFLPSRDVRNACKVQKNYDQLKGHSDTDNE